MAHRKELGMARDRKPSPLDRVRDLDLELSHAPLEHFAIHFWMQRGGKRILVGYLVYDDHCEDPISSCDGMGKIITKREDSYFLDHVGRNSDGEPMLEPYLEILARVRGITVEEFQTDEDIDENAAHETALAMWEEASAQGKVGTPFAVAIAYLDHHGYVEAESGGHRWRTDAVWVPDKALLEHIESFPEDQRREQARKCFESAMDEYNMWATGECFGVILDVFERRECGEYHHDEDKSEAVWGHVGSNWAESALADEMKWRVKHYRSLASRKIISRPVKKSIAMHP